MDRDVTSRFLLDRAVSHLNHASYGAPTRALMAYADELRADLELDTATALGAGLAPRLAHVAGRVREELGLSGGEIAMTSNATESSNALAASWPLRAGERVVLASTEYSSVVEAWRVACARAGARVDVVDVPVPTSQAALLEVLGAAMPGARVLVVSAISSPTAMRAPVADIVDLARAHGVDVVVDAAHVVGHDRFDGLEGAAAVFGTLHKWLSGPRPSGFVWVSDEARVDAYPALVALRRESPDLVERFSWRGTWDPAPMLAVPAALDELERWRRSGVIARAEALAERLGDHAAHVGLQPAVEPDLLAPRLRAFVVPGATRERVDAALEAAGVRAWVGEHDGITLVRAAVHVYSDEDDLVRFVTALAPFVKP
ncbi:aminotransferase class V-fold PLP-dependent enzyme [Cellulomonas sp. JH27-2]|uniref:aminotransferase class V-fold PLP-dependent enzyme n=1 Tax=Cellulomonas sp. JH27-2 TaxID=2774139 RepID=UPI001782FB13|nr:aminotransferase class V-fold PLP-dependent enzyme [Cellulomonas sp. JH27-2]MBD8060328.1 aminotransferase class V-fold PLP-dependent enzyme [Cellulomonas sp. JH27-2]